MIKKTEKMSRRNNISQQKDETDERCTEVLSYSNWFCLDTLNPIDDTGIMCRWTKIVAVIEAVHPQSSRQRIQK